MFCGETVALEEMLSAKEKRFEIQKRLSDMFHLPLICLMLNIPGPVKYTPELHKAFETGLEQIKRQLSFMNAEIIHSEQVIEKTGCEAFMAVKEEPFKLKRQMVIIEDYHPLGRLFDIDVSESDRKKISRQQIGAEYRKCFICGSQAQECARSRIHTVYEMQERIDLIIHDFFEKQSDDFIIQSALKALMYEVNTTPKPGLVDRANNGAHKDMDTFSFIDSTASMIPYLYSCVRKGTEYQNRSPQELFAFIRYLGQNAECDMFNATNGVNTHKGAVFSFGILCAALGYCRKIGQNTDIEAVFNTVSGMTLGIANQDFREKSSAFGCEAYRLYGVTGIRGEVISGFSSVRKFGLPVLERYISLGYSLNDAGVITLLNLIANVEDTNMIKRAGLEKAREIRTKIYELLDNKVFEKSDFYKVTEIDDYFINNNLSPGGCADLLAVAYFLHFIDMEE